VVLDLQDNVCNDRISYRILYKVSFNHSTQICNILGSPISRIISGGDV